MADLSPTFGIFLVGKPNETDVDLQIETNGFGAQINAILIKIKFQICKLNSHLGINIQVLHPLMMLDVYARNCSQTTREQSNTISIISIK